MSEDFTEPANKLKGKVSRKFLVLGFILAFIWTIIILSSLIWNIYLIKMDKRKSALIQARATFQKDVMYRRWNSNQGGVYGGISDGTPPNPYLENIPERDITTPSGKELTLINPAYMTRQVHELSMREFGVLGHITSLKPIRPANSADDWEKNALQVIEKGNSEYSSVEHIDGERYLRYMGALKTEEGCLKCHAVQGYKVGDIRGGIGVAVPLMPLVILAAKHIRETTAGHLAIWLIGLMGLAVTIRKQHSIALEKEKVDGEREKLIDELKIAMTKIKTLHGFIPICANCKKIRDDDGFWRQVEEYVTSHSEAVFSHGMCPDCMKKLYPQYADEG